MITKLFLFVLLFDLAVSWLAWSVAGNTIALHQWELTGYHRGI